MAYKFDATKLDKFREYVEVGMTKENAAVLAFGIDRSTFYNWTKEDSTLPKKKKLDLLRAYEIGRANLNNRLVLYVLKGAGDDGKLAVDFLKRIEPEEYGDRQKVVGDKDHPVEVNHTFTDEQLKRILTKPSEAKDTGSN